MGKSGSSIEIHINRARPIRFTRMLRERVSFYIYVIERGFWSGLLKVLPRSETARTRGSKDGCRDRAKTSVFFFFLKPKIPWLQANRLRAIICIEHTVHDAAINADTHSERERDPIQYTLIIRFLLIFHKAYHRHGEEKKRRICVCVSVLPELVLAHAHAHIHRRKVYFSRIWSNQPFNIFDESALLSHCCYCHCSRIDRIYVPNT